MNVVDIVKTVSSAANTLFAYATYNWTKKSIITLGVVTTAFIGGTVILKAISEEAVPTNEKKHK